MDYRIAFKKLSVTTLAFLLAFLAVFIFILLFAVLISAPFLLPFQDQIFDSVTSKGREGNLSTLSGTSSFRLFVLFHALFAPKAVGSDVVHDVNGANRPCGWLGSGQRLRPGVFLSSPASIP